MNVALIEIQDWLSCNKLSLNILKTHYMIFTSQKKIVHDVNVMICNTAIKRVYVTKFLGVQIDSKLSWNDHIKYTCKKVSKSIAILLKARKKLPKQCLFSLYYSIAFPYFIYCNQVWGCNYAECLKPLFLLQKKMIRIITSSPFRACTNHLLVSNKLLDLKDINSYMTGVSMYNIMHAP